MGSFADYLENKVLDHVLGGPDYSRPATVYMGLSTSTITDAGGNITEPVGNNYSRVAITNNDTNFPAASGGAKSNGTAITFPTPSGDWGTITDYFIADAATDGNILAAGVLGYMDGENFVPDPQTINNGNIVTFSTGDLIFSLT